MKKIFFYDTLIGEIGIAENEGSITNLFFGRDNIKEEMVIEETKTIKTAIDQLNSYFLGERFDFDLPLKPQGTEFMMSVWNELLNIPYGHTSSYGDIAKRIGNPKAARAVGLANNKNTIPIFIPCHRVVGSKGNLTGYRGGLDIKKKLLDIENINKTV